MVILWLSLLWLYATYSDIIPLCYGTCLPRLPTSMEAWRWLYDTNAVVMEWRRRNDSDQTTKAYNNASMTRMRCRFLNYDCGITTTTWRRHEDNEMTTVRQEWCDDDMTATGRRGRNDDDGTTKTAWLRWYDNECMIVCVTMTQWRRWHDNGCIIATEWQQHDYDRLTNKKGCWRINEGGMTTTAWQWDDVTEVMAMVKRHHLDVDTTAIV